MRRILRLFLKAVSPLFFLAVALLAIGVAINWHDEPLEEGTKRLLERTSRNVPDRENIFVGMAGLNAPEGQDFIEAGRKFIDEKEKKLADAPSGRHIAFENLLDSEGVKLRWQETAPPFDCKAASGEGFINCLREQKERLEKTLALNKTLIDRYLVLQSMSVYEAPENQSVWFQNDFFSFSWKLRRALMAHSLLDIDEGRFKEGLQFMEQEAILWRRLLEGKSYLVDSMIILYGVLETMHGVSISIALPGMDTKAHVDDLRQMLEPLSQKEYSMRPAIEGEFRFMRSISKGFKKWMPYQEAVEMAEMQKKIFGDKPWGITPWQEWVERNSYFFFFQPNATLNDDVPYIEAWRLLGDLSCEEYKEQRDVVLAPLAQSQSLSVNWLYNPLGKSMLRGRDPHMYDQYMGRSHDLVSYLRLVRAQLELLQASVASAEVPAFLAAMDDNTVSCDGERFNWDAETGMLSFQPTDKNFINRIPASVRVPMLKISEEVRG